MDEFDRSFVIGNAIILLSAATGVARLIDWPTAILGMLVGMLLLFYISRNGTWPGVWFTGKKAIYVGRKEIWSRSQKLELFKKHHILVTHWVSMVSHFPGTHHRGNGRRGEMRQEAQPARELQDGPGV